MRNPDGTYSCDRCAESCGNGGVADCVVVSGMDPETPDAVINFHFCRDERDEEGKVTRKGCAGKVLSARNLQHFWSTREEKENA